MVPPGSIEDLSLMATPLEALFLTRATMKETALATIRPIAVSSYLVILLEA
jgi:hypothetical protein